MKETNREDHLAFMGYSGVGKKTIGQQFLLGENLDIQTFTIFIELEVIFFF